jgi:hypothetical protein
MPPRREDAVPDGHAGARANGIRRPGLADVLARINDQAIKPSTGSMKNWAVAVERRKVVK